MTMGRSEYDQTNTGAHNYVDNLVAGADVYGSDNEKIGTVADVGQNYFLVQKGWLFIKDLYLPTSAIAQADGNNVYLSYTKHEAEQMGRDELPGTDDAWYGTQRTGTMAADTGMIDGPVEHEEVYVTERAVDRAATQEDANMRDRDIEIPLREQEVVMHKEARVVGEVNVRKEVKRDTERVSDTVRREEVHVENPNNPRVHVEGERGMTGRTGDRSVDTGYATDRTTTSDTAYDRTGMAGDRTGRQGEGIIDRAKDALRDGEDKMRNR